MRKRHKRNYLVDVQYDLDFTSYVLTLRKEISSRLWEDQLLDEELNLIRGRGYLVCDVITLMIVIKKLKAILQYTQKRGGSNIGQPIGIS